MNRASLLIGWALLTSVAIGVSSAAVGSVGDRVAPQPASVLAAASDLGGAGANTSTSAPGGADTPAGSPSSTTVATGSAGSPTTSTAVGSTPTTTGGPGTTTTTLGGATTTTTIGGATTTTIVGGTTTTPPTTVVDGTSTTTTTISDTTTTTIAPNRRTIESKGGWIRVSWFDDWLRLGPAGPRIGFEYDVLENSGELIIVRFVSKRLRHVSRIRVELDDGEAKVEVTERKMDG